MNARVDLEFGRLKYWLLLASKFLAGQGFIQALNLTTGLLLLRLLPVQEFALYSLAGALMSLTSLGSNLGLTSAFITLGARVKDDPARLGGLFATVRKYRVWLFSLVTVVVVCLIPSMASGRGWGWRVVGLSALLVIASSWVQLTQSLRTCVLDIHHDAGGLWTSGLAGAVVRLSLTLLCCWLIPSAAVALLINLLGLAAIELMLIRRGRRYMSDHAPADGQTSESVKSFVYPLVPGVIYYAFRGHIPIVLLGFFGNTTSIAQVGALGRLAQILALLGLLNAFLLQPYFARISSRTAFIKKSTLVLTVYLLASLLLLGSAFLIPRVWLFVIGPSYGDVAYLLPLAFTITLLSFMGDTLYTLLLSRGWTRGQNWTIYLGVTTQVIFISCVSINTALNALLLSLGVMLSSVAVQVVILLKSLLDDNTTWTPALQPQVALNDVL